MRPAGATVRRYPDASGRAYQTLEGQLTDRAHDGAFDAGMLTVNGGLHIHLARQLTDAIQTDPLARQYYWKPPLREVILLPDGAKAPARKYLDWHRQKVFHREGGPVIAG